MAQKTEVEIGVKDKATAELKGISGAFERMRVSVETNNKGINKLDNAFRGLGAQATQLPGPLGRIADALADFAPGGLVGGAYLAGFAAMIMIGKSYFDNAERVKKATNDLGKALSDLNNSSEQFRLTQLLNELDKIGINYTIDSNPSPEKIERIKQSIEKRKEQEKLWYETGSFITNDVTKINVYRELKEN